MDHLVGVVRGPLDSVSCQDCTAAGFGRFPERILPGYFFYAGVDLLILLGVAHDLIVNRTVHSVYLRVLPLFILGQTIVTYLAYRNVPFWLRVAHAMLG